MRGESERQATLMLGLRPAKRSGRATTMHGYLDGSRSIGWCNAPATLLTSST